MSRRLPPDQAERERIRTHLDSSQLVEAGAGSGKTTELLRRLLALIREGKAKVGEIAAVTFTRKAAAELRERFQTELESAVVRARNGDASDDAVEPCTPTELERLEAALHEIDRGFIGTIHSFCARMLRERPIEAGLDPAFREIYGPEEERLRSDAWRRHLERLTNVGDPSLDELAAVNLEHFRLFGGYEKVVNHPDVSFHAERQDPPEVGALRDELTALFDEVEAILPARRPEKGWDSFQNKIRSLRRTRWNDGWSEDAVFFDALEAIVGRNLDMTLYKWDPHRETARNIRDRMVEFGRAGSAAERTLRQWHAYRYGIAIRFVERAAAAYEAERGRAGLLSFDDLLTRATGLLRVSGSARRDLAGRYRYLLVDEFQDTDPLQAEIVFLLTATDPDETDWHAAEPRPGALFVVGDPKQSIYRFRRADIGIYSQVKNRFENFGEVVSLTTNFRSRPPIERFVNGVFENLLPAEATESQAAYAPLNVHEGDRQHQGVFWYEVIGSGASVAAVAATDAQQVASWIKQRIESKERQPEDFMVLTYRKRWLSLYAAELEKRNVPFQVTGAGVDIAEELGELLVVLRALADPDNHVSTVAALVGLFFGVDHEQLAAHRLENPLAEALGHRLFDFTADEFDEIDESGTAPEKALSQLHRWWQRTRSLPADVVVDEIVNDLGLLPYLAAGDSGGSNAGALAYVLNAVRQAGVNGDSSLRGALEALEEALGVEDAEAPLQPGRDDVVRVMNLHKAKGLEAKVVILAHPTGYKVHAPEEHIERPERGDPRGALLIEEKTGQRQRNIRLAAPIDWEALTAREEPFLKDEDVRLLYVAATRAQEELVISYCAKTEKKSPWKPFYRHKDTLCTQIELPKVDPPEPEPIELQADSIERQADELRKDRKERAVPNYEITAVTKLAKHDASIFAVDEGGLGRSWGNAVHQAMEAVARGARGDHLRAVCRTALLENDLPIDADGEPDDLDDLIGLVGRVRASDTWRRATAADKLLSEVPFAAPDAADGVTPRIIEGVVDLAFLEPDGWVIVDYKTDVVDDSDNLEARRRQYRSQVEEYARLWSDLTGEPVKERQILWVGMDLEADVW